MYLCTKPGTRALLAWWSTQRAYNDSLNRFMTQANKQSKQWGKTGSKQTGAAPPPPEHSGNGREGYVKSAQVHMETISLCRGQQAEGEGMLLHRGTKDGRFS